MNNREKCIAILDSFNEHQLANIANMLQAALDAVSEEPMILFATNYMTIIKPTQIRDNLSA